MILQIWACIIGKDCPDGQAGQAHQHVAMETRMDSREDDKVDVSTHVFLLLETQVMDKKVCCLLLFS